jgi:hypothetical protein
MLRPGRLHYDERVSGRRLLLVRQADGVYWQH